MEMRQIPRPIYKRIMKLVEKYKQSAIEDAKENHRTPLGFKVQLTHGISDILAKERVFDRRAAIEEWIEDFLTGLVHKGVLIRSGGDLVFKLENQVTPSDAELVEIAKRTLDEVLGQKK